MINRASADHIDDFAIEAKWLGLTLGGALEREWRFALLVLHLEQVENSLHLHENLLSRLFRGRFRNGH